MALPCLAWISRPTCFGASMPTGSCHLGSGEVYLGQLEGDMLDFQVALKIEKRLLRRSHL